MGSPQPAETPLDGEGVCQAWATPAELPQDVHDMHPEDTWCVILAYVSDVLWAASGRRWRNVQADETVTLDRIERDCQPHRSGVTWRWGYQWPMLCTPDRPRRVRLPRPDVTEVTEVTVDGDTTLDWRRTGSWLIRTDGHGWPLDETVRITYRFGRPVPNSGRLAAIGLATEIGKALLGKTCGLPQRATSMTRQGITYDTLESLEYLQQGLTGFPPVDVWIKTHNPGWRRQQMQQGQVWSPDMIEARRV